jgi:hypothetical protein
MKIDGEVSRKVPGNIEKVSKTPETFWTLSKLYLSMDFVSQEHGVPHDGPKDLNAGGCTCEILDRNETR